MVSKKYKYTRRRSAGEKIRNFSIASLCCAVTIAGVGFLTNSFARTEEYTSDWVDVWKGASGEGSNWFTQNVDDGYIGVGSIVTGGNMMEFVSGDGDSSNIRTDAHLTKYSSDTSVEWIAQYGDEEHDELFVYANQTSDGGYLAVGYATDLNADGDADENADTTAIIAKYDADGNMIWSKSWGGNGEDYFNKYFELSTGGFIVVGSTYSTDISGLTNNGDEDAIILQYDNDGNLLNSMIFGGIGADGFNAALLTNDDKMILVGYQTIDGKQREGIIQKRELDGSLIWQKTWGGIGDDSFVDIVQFDDKYLVAADMMSASVEADGLEKLTGSTNRYNIATIWYSGDRVWGFGNIETTATESNGSKTLDGNNYSPDGIIIEFDDSDDGDSDDVAMNYLENTQLANGNTSYTYGEELFFQSLSKVSDSEVIISAITTWSSDSEGIIIDLKKTSTILDEIDEYDNLEEFVDSLNEDYDNEATLKEAFEELVETGKTKEELKQTIIDSLADGTTPDFFSAGVGAIGCHAPSKGPIALIDNDKVAYSFTEGTIISTYSYFQRTRFDFIDLDPDECISSPMILTNNACKSNDDNGYVVAGVTYNTPHGSINGVNIDGNLGFADKKILKVDDDGNLLWEKTVAYSANYYEMNDRIVTVSDGYIYIHSEIKDDITGVGEFPSVTIDSNFTNSNEYSYTTVFTKVDNDGNFVWRKAMPVMSGDDDYTYVRVNTPNIEMMTNGDLLVFGDYAATNTSSNVNSANSRVEYYARLDGLTGEIKWAETTSNHYEIDYSDSNNNLYAVIAHNSSLSNSDALIVYEENASGYLEEKYSKTISGYSDIMGITFTNKGIVVLGSKSSDAGAYLMVFDTNNGDQLFSAVYVPEDNDNYEDILFVNGMQNNDGSKFYATLSYGNDSGSYGTGYVEFDVSDDGFEMSHVELIDPTDIINDSSVVYYVINPNIVGIEEGRPIIIGTGAIISYRGNIEANGLIAKLHNEITLDLTLHGNNNIDGSCAIKKGSSAYDCENLEALEGDWHYPAWYYDEAHTNRYRGEAITDDLELYYLGSNEPETYTVTIKDENGEVLEEIDVLYGEEPELEEPEIECDEGYKCVFAGWNEEITPVTEDTEYTALFNISPISYHILFASNEGTGEMEGKDATYDAEQSLPENTFERNGYTFLGWSTNPDATEPEYENGDVIKNLTTEEDAEITLYAIWKQDEVEEPEDGDEDEKESEDENEGDKREQGDTNSDESENDDKEKDETKTDGEQTDDSKKGEGSTSKTNESITDKGNNQTDNKNDSAADIPDTGSVTENESTGKNVIILPIFATLIFGAAKLSKKRKNARRLY